MKPLLGIPLHPDRDYLRRVRRLAEDEADVFEVTPEMLWTASLEPTPAHAAFLELRARSGKPFLGHGIALSLGSGPLDERARRWLARLEQDSRAFGFLWLSEHLGFTEHAGRNVALPIPLPPTREAALAVAARLRALAPLAPLVAFENSASTFAIGDPRRDPELWNEIARESGASILLDLHNAYVTCVVNRLALDEYLAPLDLARVVEIHLAGGSESEPEWLPSRRVFRLDSHDGPVPDEVWRAFERLLPRCPSLRAVIVERVETGLSDDQVEEYERDVRRAREVLCSRR